MTIAFQLLAGGLFLYLGAEWLVRGSASLALRLGVSSLVVGLTVVSFGTSAPEMVVSVKAALSGLGSIAIGNVIGSNISNIAIILGLSALLRPMKVNRRLLRFDAPFMVLVTLLFFVMMEDQVLERREAGLLFVGIITYTSLMVIISRRDRKRAALIGAGADLNGVGKSSLFRDVVFIVLGLSVLVAGSHLFVNGSTSLAKMLGVSEAVIALTIVALGTSLPELATSVVASVKGQEDIAVGNVIGSNILNLLAILGVSGMLTPLSPRGIGLVDLAVMAGLSLLLLTVMYWRLKIGRMEGAFFLLIYLVYLFYLWP